ncbi:MMPL family transporter [Duganella sp. BJB1802]|nr:MMPL family transporter [Duganella sp. BJB1802]NVD69596.1 MMPL family transporter [Duganella sp. BJB1802]
MTVSNKQAGAWPVIAKLADFDTRSGSWVERTLFNNRIWVVALCVLMTLFLGGSALRLQLNGSFERMIPTGHEFVRNYLEHRDDLAGVGNTLRIAVHNQGGTIYDAPYQETLRKLNDEVFLVPGVERPFMKSLWTANTRWLGVTEDGLDGGPVIPDNFDGGQQSMAELRMNVERSGEIGRLVAPDLHSSLILVPLTAASADGKPLDYQDLSHRLEQLRAKYAKGPISIHITGFAKVAGDLIDGVAAMAGYFALALVMCTAALYAYSRCVRSTVVVMTCSLIAVLWTLGALQKLGYVLDPYTVLVPFLVFAIGASHGAQKMNGIAGDVASGTHKVVAARYTFRRLFIAGLTALLADALGFAVLTIIDIQIIRDLALTAGIGMAALILTNLVLLPILLSYTGVNVRSREDGRMTQAMWRWLVRFTQPRQARLAVAVALVLAIVGTAGSMRLTVGDLDPGAPELRPDSRYNVDSAFMTANFPSSSDMFVVMVKTPKFMCTRHETLVAVDALEWKLQQLPGVESTSSFASLAKRAAVGISEGNPRWYDMPNQETLNSITSRAPRELFNQACDLLAVYVYLSDHRAQTLDRVVRETQAFAAQFGEGAETRFLLAGGNAGIEAATNIVVKKSNWVMTLLVYLSVMALAMLTFRSWRATLAAMLPLMLTTVLLEALMAVLGIGLKVATLPVVALGVGIGVDYSLYVLSVTLGAMRAGASLADAYALALRFTGRVVVLTGLTLAAAVFTWVLSPIRFQADMGLLLGFMFIWNMLGALILLPALAYYLLKPGRIAVTATQASTSVTARECA